MHNLCESEQNGRKEREREGEAVEEVKTQASGLNFHQNTRRTVFILHVRERERGTRRTLVSPIATRCTR